MLTRKSEIWLYLLYNEYISLLILVLGSCPVMGQRIGSFLPERINPKERFLFYQHGGVVTTKGNNAITNAAPEWGPYEYLNILDTLKNRGFKVISENRKEGVNNSVYINKILMQIDSLLKQGVKAKNIIVVGASARWEITLGISAKLPNDKVKYVIMGGCNLFLMRLPSGLRSALVYLTFLSESQRLRYRIAYHVLPKVLDLFDHPS